jgi:hypothetical protein
MSPEKIGEYCLNHPDTLAMLMLQEQDKKTQKEKIVCFGSWPEDCLHI